MNIRQLYTLVVRMLALGHLMDNDEITADDMRVRMNEWEEEDVELFHIATGFAMLVSALSDVTWAIKAMNQIAEGAANGGNMSSAIADGLLAKRAIDAANSNSEQALSGFVAGLLGSATEGGADREELANAVRSLFPEELVERLLPQIDVAIFARERVR